jgi:hypothetical protein
MSLAKRRRGWLWNEHEKVRENNIKNVVKFMGTEGFEPPPRTDFQVKYHILMVPGDPQTLFWLDYEPC